MRWKAKAENLRVEPERQIRAAQNPRTQGLEGFLLVSVSGCLLVALLPLKQLLLSLLLGQWIVYVVVVVVVLCVCMRIVQCVVWIRCGGVL